jgi:hypothetical protein
LREETPSEREAYMKNHVDDTDDKYSLLRKQLPSIRGPVRFEDLVDHDDAHPPSTEDTPPEASKRDEEQSVDGMLREIFEDQHNNVPPTNASVNTRLHRTWQSENSSLTNTKCRNNNHFSGKPHKKNDKEVATVRDSAIGIRE